MSGCSNSSAVMTYYSKECGSASAELQVQQQQAVRVCVRVYFGVSVCLLCAQHEKQGEQCVPASPLRTH